MLIETPPPRVLGFDAASLLRGEREMVPLARRGVWDKRKTGPLVSSACVSCWFSSTQNRAIRCFR